MNLDYNKFQKLIDKSNEKLFQQLTEIFSMSDNAALVAMFDDKLILLDEETNQFYLVDYLFENDILHVYNFEKIVLTEGANQFDELLDKLFDVDDSSSVYLNDLVEAFKEKYVTPDRNIVEEVKYKKYKTIMENSKIRALKKVRQVRDLFEDEIKTLLEDPFIKHINTQLFPKAKKDNLSMVSTLNKVNFKTPYKITVNTDVGNPVNIKIKDNVNVMDAMKNVAKRLNNLWKSESFRKKFEQMIKKLLTTESVELQKVEVLNFLEENKELFLLNKDLFEEVLVKTSLLTGYTDTDSVIRIFNTIMESFEAKKMKKLFLEDSNISEQKIKELNILLEEGDEASLDSLDSTSDKESDNSLDTDNNSVEIDTEALNKIIKIFKKIREQLDDDTPEANYVDSLISSLDVAKVKNLDSDKLKEIIDFLNSVGTSKKEKDLKSTSDELASSEKSSSDESL